MGDIAGVDERFRLLVESVRDYAIYILDPSGIVTTWNAGAERLKGYKAEEIVGQSFTKFFPPEEVASGKCERELEIARREGRYQEDGWRVRKDGSRFYAHAVITAMHDPAGKLVGFAKVTQDLTERRQAEATSAAYDRLKVLMGLSAALSKAVSLDDVTTVVIEQGMRMAHADTCTIYRHDALAGVLRLIGDRGVAPEVLERIRRVPLRQGAAPREPMFAETPQEYAARIPDVSSVSTSSGQRRAKAFWSVPLIAEGRPVGLLGMGFYEPRRFVAEDRELIIAFSQQCAEAMLRAIRFDDERVARAKLATTLHSIGDAVITTDAAGRVDIMNPVAEALTQWSQSDAKGKPLTEVFHIINEHTRAAVDNPAEKVLALGAIVGLANHTVLVGRAGVEVPIEDSGAPIRSEGAPVQGVVLVFRDATERKRAEWRQRFLADAASSLAETLHYEATLVRAAQMIVPGLADWCGIDMVDEGSKRSRRIAVAHIDPAKVALAKEFEERFPTDPDAKTGLANVLRTGKAELYSDIPDEMIVRSARSEEHLRVARSLGLRSAMVVPIKTRAGVRGAVTFVMAESARRYDADDLAFAEEVAQRLAVAVENAELYRAEQLARAAADAANRAKDEFLAIVSHELRTPLSSIVGWSKLLSADDLPDSRRAQGMETVARNAVAMAELVDDLLDMSRVVSGKLALDLKPVRLDAAVNAAVETCRNAAQAKEIDLRSRVEPLVLSVGDETRLQQVVWNLLSNAVKFTPRGGIVEVELRRADGVAQIKVIDTGPGIDAEFLPHVFDAFTQQDKGTTRRHGGLGLGLAITRHIVELHGGVIQARSEGVGTTFIVTLPLREPPAETSAPRGSRGSRQRPDLAGLRVLVVDDEPDARALMTAMLTDYGCKVITAGSADDAIDHIRRDQPDVLLSDISMPDRDGYDLIRQVRALPEGAELPAVALTAYARVADVQRALEAGFNAHLRKPVDPDEVVSTLVNVRSLKPN